MEALTAVTLRTCRSVSMYGRLKKLTPPWWLSAPPGTSTA